MTAAHEPRSGPGTHLSADDLSALAEGAQPSTAGAAEHLQECAACRGEVDAMSELLAQFAEWDTPAMPQEVAIRIDAALARESAARAATSGHPAAAASGSEASASKSASSGTASGSGLSGSSPESVSSGGAPLRGLSSGTGSSSAGSSGNTSPPRRRRRRPAPGLSWAAAALVLIAGGVGLIVKLSSGSPSYTTSSGSAVTQPFKSLRSPEVNGPNADGQAGPSPSSVRAPGSPLAVWTTQTLSNHRMSALVDQSCLSDPAFGGSHELATASGDYEGQAAALVVYANPKNPATVLAVVYAAPCTGANFHVLDTGLVAATP